MKTITILLFPFLFLSCQKDMKPISSNSLDNIASATKPNVIVILGDDVGYELLSVNGCQSYNTPNLDRLASKGVRFTQCHATPLCSPSRVELLTGKYNFRNYVGFGRLPTNNRTIGNMFKDAGYSTGIFGKWQLDGGDASMKAFGFDNYIIREPFDSLVNNVFPYRGANLYTHGAFLPQDMTKYSEDIIRDSLYAFMDKNVKAKKPFFAYYPMVLVHKPFQPTPDDANFLTFDVNTSDNSYFPSMVKYMDKLIGQLMAKVNDLNIADNTIIIFSGDNGTPLQAPLTLYQNVLVAGGKGKTTEWGTHVPLIAYWRGHTTNGVDSSLIDFTDFVPTLAQLGETNKKGFGVTDGVSFYHNLMGNVGINRDWVFCHFNSHPEDGEGKSQSADRFTRWVQNTTYKKYDTIAFPYWKEGQFMNFTKDLLEPTTDILTNPTRKERQLDSVFQTILDTLR